MKKPKPDLRAQQLKVHIEKMSPNLVRAHVLDMLELAPPEEVEKLIVAFGAQNAVKRGG